MTKTYKLSKSALSAARKAGFFSKKGVMKVKNLRRERGRKKAETIRKITESNLPKEKKAREIEQIRGKGFFSRFRRKKSVDKPRHPYGGFESAY